MGMAHSQQQAPAPLAAVLLPEVLFADGAAVLKPAIEADFRVSAALMELANIYPRGTLMAVGVVKCCPWCRCSDGQPAVPCWCSQESCSLCGVQPSSLMRGRSCWCVCAAALHFLPVQSCLPGARLAALHFLPVQAPDDMLVAVMQDLLAHMHLPGLQVLARERCLTCRWSLELLWGCCPQLDADGVTAAAREVATHMHLGPEAATRVVIGNRLLMCLAKHPCENWPHRLCMCVPLLLRRWPALLWLHGALHMGCPCGVPAC
jgi:hypothetical protein